MRRFLESRVFILLVAVAVVFVAASVASACPNCKEAMEKQDPSHGGIVKGYFYSILFMMGTPYLVFGTFCGVMYYRVRRARLAGKPKRPLAGAAAIHKAESDVCSIVPSEPRRSNSPEPLEV